MATAQVTVRPSRSTGVGFILLGVVAFVGVFLMARANPGFFFPVAYAGYAIAALMVLMGIFYLARGKGWGAAAQIEVEDGRGP